MTAVAFVLGFVFGALVAYLIARPGKKTMRDTYIPFGNDAQFFQRWNKEE